MTPAERAVLDAARAIAPVVEHLIASLDADDYGYRVAGENALRRLEAAAPAFLAAVRALPRPLSEQLAELRVGDIVEDDDGCMFTVLMAHQPSKTVFVEWVDASGSMTSDIINFEHITRIISNPEESNG